MIITENDKKDPYYSEAVWRIKYDSETVGLKTEEEITAYLIGFLRGANWVSDNKDWNES